jgi:Domain of unknown function (DUF4886)
MVAIMRLGLWLSCLFLLGACDIANGPVPAPAPPPITAPDAAHPDLLRKPMLRVLFLGNSFTYVNELPTVVAALASEVTSPVSVTVAEHAPGGATWEDHDRDAAVVPLLQQGWDYVVLQDQSEQPWLYHGGIKPALLSLDAKIKAAGAKTILFMTWARQLQTGVTIAQRFEEDVAINNYYERHAAAVGAEVAPVGRAWERVLRDPALSLHSDDGVHPNERGTYLAACVFYVALTHASPLGLGSGGLHVTPDERALLQQAAWDTHLARQRLLSPAIGAWPLSAGAGGNDVVPFQAATGAYAALPYVPGMNTQHFTIAVRAHRSDWSVPAANGYEALLEKNWGYGLWQTQGSVEARLFTVDQNAAPYPSYSVLGLASGWHQFAMTYDGAEYGLWIDGAEVASGTASGDLAYTQWLGPDVGAGAGADYPFNAIAAGVNTVDTALSGATPVAAFTGTLADVRLFDRALSESEILSLLPLKSK